MPTNTHRLLVENREKPFWAYRYIQMLTDTNKRILLDMQEVTGSGSVSPTTYRIHGLGDLLPNLIVCLWPCLLVATSGNIVNTQFVAIPDVQSPAEHNGMGPCLVFSRILDLQHTGDFKPRIPRFREGHMAIVCVEIKHPVSVCQTAVSILVGGLNRSRLEDGLSRREINAHPRLPPLLRLRVSVESAVDQNKAPVLIIERLIQPMLFDRALVAGNVELQR